MLKLVLTDNNNDNDVDDDSLLHIFALKMNYNMFTLAIRKNIKIYTFRNNTNNNNTNKHLLGLL